VEAGVLKFQEDGEPTLTYQDPCRLGRHLGVVDAPRRVLSSMPGATLVEMGRSGRDALCCGTSGFIHCNAASRELQERRLAEAARTGADTLVTACPKCLIHFACAQDEDRRSGRGKTRIEVQDFTVLAAGRLAAGGQEESEVPAAPERETGEKR
jgi:Fe-S oxidoreductase